MFQASRRSAVSPFLAMDVLSAATLKERAGERVIHMEVGEPGSPTPLPVRAAAQRVLEAGRVGYTEALGLPALRARIAQHYADWYGVSLDPARVVVTTGSSGGFTLSFLALFDVGARVAIAAPGYPAYRNILQALGLVVVDLPTSKLSRYAVTAEMIRRAHAEQRLDGVLLMSPANPSGTMMLPEELAAVAATCEGLGIRFISDEIYHGLTYERPAETALRSSDSVVVVNSFSKYFCMTGWRVGWLVVPEPPVRTMERLQQSLSISVPTLSQVAALAAFEAQPELERIRDAYAANRQVLLEALPRLGFTDLHPVDGAFYCYADVSRLSNDSVELCRLMLDQTGVAATPGIDIDPERGRSTLRLSFAGPQADVVEAVQRLETWLPRL
ncbi:aminotransferase class I/II-fold pyridoxal phosphate-dependent enzyme [Lichenihabitans sp. Uapishka_5]|uniref:pyridoxal phosphate-dependent aminotransferase n=1 Tax=Lichenihabitans sp. Uapishka_5 TaxID=3037302 RepID=UPI0029E7E141|nr:aminotransferase class I/II-fold pyridoxal phosphate-dependent enzyme [Lichenihabitans sp. Uapishka_5]MDX7950174.1 aminotransferase class I/II-fold pyridoxal phosphate-dependent enzyme [Lichenihabitans sp. Uapishka_5]